MRTIRKATSLLVLAGGLAVVVAAGASSKGSPGFTTAQPPMLEGAAAAGSSYEPIISVGDTLQGGYMFESIPDGIAFSKNGKGTVDVLVNHETSTVPFPYTFTTGVGCNDFTNAMVSELRLSQNGGGVLRGRYVIESSQNYQRFCSSFLATAEQGFERELLLTNEEGIDWVNRTGTAWPATVGADEARQIGAVIAYDPKSDQSRPIWGMGRHNHENSVAIPGYGHPVVLSGDDSFVTTPAQSQVYSYIAANANDVWQDQGDLWAFVSDNPAFDGYEDFAPGSTQAVSGRFVKVPKLIATGRNPDGTELMAADVGYPLPPATGWQTANGVPLDGPQWVLEHWSDLNGVFQFIRVEDVAYDRRTGMQNVVYVADSGRGTAGAPAAGRSTNGRIWKMVLDPADPTTVLSLSILIEGDDAPVKAAGEIHQPDNLETTAKSLLVTEDPGSSQQFFPDEANATTARIWKHDLASGANTVAARVNQSADENATPGDGIPDDQDAAVVGKLGAWEASGIIDASSIFGPGAFLVDVQAGSYVIDQEVRGTLTYQRDGGQLGILWIPGA
jgi:hypothetical protein